MRKILRDLADGFEAIFGPIRMPVWLHRAVWTVTWAIWIIAATGWVYERLSS